NLQAFENFLASLPQFLLREQAPAPQAPTGPQRVLRPQPAMAAVGANGEGEKEVTIDLPFKRSLPKVGRNEPCPCGSGKKYKNCCGRVASRDRAELRLRGPRFFIYQHSTINQ